jgi:hypothetical protein
MLARGLVAAVHGRPLKGRVRLGHEGRHRGRHLGGAQVAAADGLHARGGLDDAEHVLVGFGGQADHEVQLHALVPAREHALGGFQDVGLGDVLVDEVAHALGAGLGRKGQARDAARGQIAQQFLVEAVGAQRGHRQRHLVVAQLWPWPGEPAASRTNSRPATATPARSRRSRLCEYRPPARR